MKIFNPVSFLIIALISVSSCSIQDEQLNFAELNKEVILKSGENYLDRQMNVEADNNGTLKSAKKHSVPFKSNFVLWSDEIPTGYEINIEVYGLGTATCMGKTSLIINQIIYTTLNPWKATASVIATSANGDELHFEYVCEMDLSQTPDFIFKGTCEVTGGTGKFKNAEGDLKYNGRFNWSALTGTATINGDIKY